MKNLFYIFLTGALILIGLQSKSQGANRPANCDDTFIIHQADSIKLELSKQGFIVVKEASMSMESEFEIPVIVPLTQGSWYQFVFIGDITSRL